MNTEELGRFASILICGSDETSLRTLQDNFRTGEKYECRFKNALKNLSKRKVMQIFGLITIADSQAESIVSCNLL